MSAFLWCLFEETPRPQPLPTFPFPNHHPFSVRCQESLGPLVPVGEGPLSSYHDHILIPVPGELGGPPLWTPVSPAMVGSPAASPATFLESIPTDPQRSKSISPVPNSIPPEPEIIDTFPEPRKTYLSRRARGLPPLQCFSSDVGNQAVTLLSQNLAPERRRKGERRCGRFVFQTLLFPLCVISIFFTVLLPGAIPAGQWNAMHAKVAQPRQGSKVVWEDLPALDKHRSRIQAWNCRHPLPTIGVHLEMWSQMKNSRHAKAVLASRIF